MLANWGGGAACSFQSLKNIPVTRHNPGCRCLCKKEQNKTTTKTGGDQCCTACPPFFLGFFPTLLNGSFPAFTATEHSRVAFASIICVQYIFPAALGSRELILDHPPHAPPLPPYHKKILGLLEAACLQPRSCSRSMSAKAKMTSALLPLESESAFCTVLAAAWHTKTERPLLLVRPEAPSGI